MLAITYENEVGGSSIFVEERFRKLSLDITQNAEEGSTGISQMVFDDANGDADFVGWRRIRIYEDEESDGYTLLANLWVYPRDIERNAKRTQAARDWTLSVADMNAILEMRVLTTSDANRPAETDVERIQWLLTTNAASRITTDEFVSTSSPKAMDANDYRGQTVAGVIEDCARQSGKNYFAYTKDNGIGEGLDIGLFYDYDYSTAYTAAIEFSNIIGDVDDSTTFFMNLDATLTRDPGRVYSGAYLRYDGGAVYVENDTTRAVFTRRDVVYDEPNVHTETKALARANRYLSTINEEEDRITFSAYLPRDKVNHAREGQRVRFRTSHLPGYQTFSYKRILQRKVTEVSEGFEDAYLVTYTVTGRPVPPCGALGLTQESGVEYGNGTNDLPAAPADCLQVWVENIRISPATGTPHVPDGFTEVGHAYNAALGTGRITMAYRVTQTGDTGSVDSNETGADRSHVLYEFAGVSAVADTAIGNEIPNAGSVTTAAVTPEGGAPTLIIAVLQKDGPGPAGGGTVPDLAVSSPATQLDEASTQLAGQSPTMIVGYQLISSASGSYDMTFTGDTTGFANGPLCYIIAAFR